ncbi:F-box only protein 21-like [Melitaea cinxia]|uniref:F-box only protein 21-like n=1 Tax=Melitaea cinxia TaxID=113334 RepID=UPI001E272F9B|nr:F-box only protein 21-like [Melitaea cinxia]
MEGINNTNITCLPDEIISLILKNNDPREIIRFSVTCKQFYENVICNDYLWKIKYSEIFPKEMVKIVEEHCNSNWLKEIIQYYKLKRKNYIELVCMSPKYYWRINEVSLEDVKIFFSFATETNLSFFYTIYILQNIVKTGNYYLDNFTILKPLYTLTVVYYAKIALRHLIQTYLAVKWVDLHMRQKLTPEVVITFFVQWVDPTCIYSDEEVENKIQSLVTKVKGFLRDVHSKKNREQDVEKYSDKQILSALSQVIYKSENFSISSSTKVITLNIAKVIDKSNGNAITYAVIYQAVAKRLGVKCELIVFPNHLFLEWQDNDMPHKPLYTVDLITGEIKPKRQCPFSQSAYSRYEYSPDSLLQYVYSSYMKSKGALRDCKTQNAIHLLDFLETRQLNHNPYRNFLPYLVDHVNPALTTSLNMKFIQNDHMQLILTLSNLNTPPEVAYHQVQVKKHRDSVKYAVGMICYHKLYNYMCCVRGWEYNGAHLRIPIDNNLYFGREQPFYRVIAGDQSERFVAQENLIAVTTPFRIYCLEDHIAREFTHYNGFSYVPNAEKKIEYPNEEHVTEVFRRRFVNVATP